MSSQSEIVKAIKMSEGSGAIVKRAFPTNSRSFIDPFVLMDEFFVESPASFPEHPHRGFEAITYMIEGGFKHKDTSGAEALVEQGGVQRITMGKGVRHSELPGSEGLNHGIQLWINLPQKLKNIEPSYQVVSESDQPIKKSNGKIVKTIVGENSPVKLKTNIQYEAINLNGSSYDFSIAEEENGFLYFISGRANLIFNSEKRGIKEGMLLVKEGNFKLNIQVEVLNAVHFITLKGKPHNEPINLLGSFVD